ncbi:hypothetical protein FACS1894188_08080 [Clostridia bacterium]|nr:hypothetical protein FACS1894188_08080 [Clostridia bacterium]
MFLVVSFDNERAAEILSEPQGERRNFTPSYFKRQGSAGSAEASVGSVVAFEPGALQRIDKAAWEDQARTLRRRMGDNQTAVAYAVPLDLRNAVRNGGEQGTGIGENGEPSYTLTSEYTHGVALEQHIIENHANDSRYKLCEKYAPCVNARSGLGGGNVDLCVEIKPIMLDERKQAAPITEGYVGSLTATDYKGTAVYFEPTIALQGNLIGRANGNGPLGKGYKEEQSYTINTIDKGGAVCYCEQVSALTTELAHGTGSQGQVGGQLVVEKEPVCYQNTVGALCASDWRGIRNQDIGEDKAIVETETFGNSGFGKWRENDTAGQTIKSSGGDFQGSENVVVEKSYAVRRLTPLECLRACSKSF